MELNLNVIAGAGARWLRRKGEREDARAKIASGRAIEAETPQRVQLRLQRLAEAATWQRGARAVIGPASSLVDALGVERVIGAVDFLGIQFLELALAVSRYVGRIHIRSEPGRTAGFGTGFMVSPRLLLTNNHVLPGSEDARHSEVEFDYQYGRNGQMLPVQTFALEPKTFFLTDSELDYTLIAVRQRARSGTEVKGYGWSRLIGTQGKALLGESLNIIQHPRGEAKQIVLRSNQLVDLFDHFAHYVTDTEPGSSGSPVYNDQWELVALHHSGVPRMDGNRNYLTKDGTIWRPGMDPDLIDWVANEGIRVSSLLEHIQSQPLNATQERLRDELLTLQPPDPIEAAQKAAASTSIGGAASDSATGERPSGAQTWIIPLEVTVRVGAPTTGSGAPVMKTATSLGPAIQTGLKVSEWPGFAAPTPALRNALTELEEAPSREYYNEAKDRQARDAYYAGISISSAPAELYAKLSSLLKETHKALSYQPATHVYPWVDLHESQPKPVLRSIYSGKTFDPKKLIEEDFRIEQERARIREMLTREASFSHEVNFDFLEATLPFNCEHVVPQSWFNKREPMRGDLHHLFACEPACNSFRGNTPYFDFADFEEVVRDACGKSEQGKFEPSAGKGAVARATLYFLLRYPKEINRTAKEYTEDRIETLLRWHEADPVSRYERHRNVAIFDKQGNRNPLIDFPQWARKIDFTRGLG